MGERLADPAIIEPAEGGGGSNMVTLVVAMVLAVVVAVGLAVFIVSRMIAPNIERARLERENTEQTRAGVQQILASKKEYPFDSIVVNLSGSNAERIMKVTVVFGYEFDNGGAPDVEDPLGGDEGELVRRKGEIRNQLISILGSKTLAQVDSAEGREAIRREILSRVNGLLVSGRITDVFYTEFVIQ